MKSYLIPSLTLGILAASVGQAQAIDISFDTFTSHFGNGTVSNSTSPINFTGTFSAPPSTSLADGLFIQKTSSSWAVRNGSNASTVGAAAISNTIGAVTVTRNSTINTTGFLTGTPGAPTGSREGRISYLNNETVGSNGTVRFDVGTNSQATATIKYSFSQLLDLIDSGNDVIRVGSANIGGINGNLGLSVKVTDNDSFSSLSYGSSLTGVQNADFAFNLFSGIDFTKVTEVEFSFNQPTGDADNNFLFIGATDTTPVPEPLTILGTLVAGGIGAAMKKKKDAVQADS